MTRARQWIPYGVLWGGVVGLIAVLLVLRFSMSLSRMLVPFSAYFPFVILAYALIVAGVVLVLRGIPATARGLLAGAPLLLFACVYGPRFIPRLHSPTGGVLRVATWNVFLCRYGVSGIRETIGDLGADILALQEVVASETDSGEWAQLDAIVKPMGYRWAFVGYRPGRPGRQPGIAICVREPVRLLSIERRTYHPTGKWRYVFVEVEFQGRRLNVVVPHLYPFAFGSVAVEGRSDLRFMFRRMAQRMVATTHWHLREGNELVRLVGTFRDPTLILGDFNSAPDHPIHWKLRRRLTDCLFAAGRGLSSTFRFFLPVRIDYIYATPTINVHAAAVAATTASDHKPVVALVSIRDDIHR